MPDFERKHRVPDSDFVRMLLKLPDVTGSGLMVNHGWPIPKTDGTDPEEEAARKLSNLVTSLRSAGAMRAPDIHVEAPIVHVPAPVVHLDMNGTPLRLAVPVAIIWLVFVQLVAVGLLGYLALR